MTLELSKIAHQIQGMGNALAERAKRERQVLPAARALLHQFADRQQELGQIVQSEDGRRLRCAGTSSEILDAVFPAPTLPDRLTLIAADGSQIYPDRHAAAFYFVINVGSIVFRQGTGEAPSVGTDPRLYYAEDDLYPDGNMVAGELVSAMRSVAEADALARLAETEPGDGPPRVALADGPLLIWLRGAGIPLAQQERLLAETLHSLGRLRRSQTPAVGFVSRPHSAEVVTLLYLAHLQPEERASMTGLHDTGFRGLTDRALFGFLRPGERSALFIRGTPDNQAYRASGHTVYFFYLSTGPDVARVEVPEWVALHPPWLNMAHSAVVDQCRLNNGYPYVLTRADEQAVILGQEREVLEGMLLQAMARQGLDWPELSRKAQQKQVARWRRR
jgi:hypothetical protein